MAASAATPAPARIDLAINEARSRFVQLVRLTRLNRQVTVIVEQGQAVAAIVPVDLLDPRRDEPDPAAGNAAGWLQRLEKVRHDLRGQHAARTAELRQALDEAWGIVDQLRPAGADRQIDIQRAAHAHLRRKD
ncbi:hypothetical protein [Paractinoplanes toevensis]|uniref:Antitoxin n=1 Tax=Paractinoplanes toevensis TaxID=571911 RepID=A0A919VZ86_9ACTN|nr:hypothetical protein [Actinoplanes toevensis]GIM89867.1 hypothetical protein Ato02nite_016600 [Actinoplanes toevensis]